ncbi:hypothetical protein HNV12_13530 [Methanococcoides sp. SA1]|nr:hypothetical protein [Methanococcoides sp. SA1]
MAIDSLSVGYAIAYGIFISILIWMYVRYSKIVLIHYQFGKFDDFKIVYFFILATSFTLTGYFFGPLDSSGALLITIIASTGPIFGIYLYANSHPEVPNISKLNLTVLWILHAIPLCLILFFHDEMFQYIITLVEENL